MPKYDVKFIEDVGNEAEGLRDPSKRAAMTAAYAVDMPEGFADVPVLEVCRTVNQGDEGGIKFDDMERLTRFCILGKPITITYNGKSLGTVIMNKMTDSFDAYPMFKDHPTALSFLMNVCMAYVLKRSLPPQQAAPVAAAPAKGPQLLVQ